MSPSRELAFLGRVAREVFTKKVTLNKDMKEVRELALLLSRGRILQTDSAEGPKVHPGPLRSREEIRGSPGGGESEEANIL